MVTEGRTDQFVVYERITAWVLSTAAPVVNDDGVVYANTHTHTHTHTLSLSLSLSQRYSTRTICRPIATSVLSIQRTAMKSTFSRLLPDLKKKEKKEPS